MGCRWGVLSFKLKFNRTPMMLNIKFNFNIYFYGHPSSLPASQLS